MYRDRHVEASEMLCVNAELGQEPVAMHGYHGSLRTECPASVACNWSGQATEQNVDEGLPLSVCPIPSNASEWHKLRFISSWIGGEPASCDWRQESQR